MIQRFSEDIDLSLSPSFLRLDVPTTLSTLSRNQALKWMKKAEAECALAVESQVRQELEGTIATILGGRDQPWLEFAIDSTTRSPILKFSYPATQTVGFGYLERSVKLEFGSLTDQAPTGRHPVRPWIAIELPEEFLDWNCEVTSLNVERTFWEKAVILHVEYFRPLDKPTPPRFSRHYADTAALANHPAVAPAMTSLELLERVVAWKSCFFASNWARYDLAKPGTLRLRPPPHREADLRRVYRSMRDMYPQEPVEFDSILTTLANLEERVNSIGR